MQIAIDPYNLASMMLVVVISGCATFHYSSPCFAVGIANTKSNDSDIGKSNSNNNEMKRKKCGNGMEITFYKMKKQRVKE